MNRWLLWLPGKWKVWQLGPVHSITFNRLRIGLRSKWFGFVWYLDGRARYGWFGGWGHP